MLAIRPDSWNHPLLVHVLGAALLMGTLVLAVAALLVAARRDRDNALAVTRLGFWTLLAGALPSYVVMRVGAEWINSEANFGEPAWIAIGYTTADIGLLVMIVATVLAGIGVRRMRSGAGGETLGRVAGGLSVLLVIAYVATVWAMTAKPD